MAPTRSNIGITLNKKRKMGFLKKLGVYFIFVLFFVSLGVWALTTEPLQIKDVVISGNSSISSADITSVVRTEMGIDYLWIIQTNNIFLLRRSNIKNKILDTFKKIGSVNISIRGIDKITVSVTERESKYLWCTGQPTDYSNCYFMDSDGFIFEQAPIFSNDIFPKYFGLIDIKNPIGLYYFGGDFKKISSLYDLLNRMSFSPQCFNAIDQHEYEVCLPGGGKILINDEKDFESSLINLQALVDNNYIKTDSDSLKKIKYIDLRFGNKVNFSLNKQ